MSTMHMEREIYHTYLVWEPDEARGEEDYGIKMLQNNTFNYFLPFQLRSTDACLKYYYDVMSDTSLGSQMEKGLGLKELELFAESLLGAFDEADEYLLDENDILLDADCIFFTDEGRYRFLYYPGCCGSSPARLKELAGVFLKAVDYTCTGAVQSVYEFYHLCCGEATILKNLRGYVLKGRDYRQQEKGLVGAEENILPREDPGGIEGSSVNMEETLYEKPFYEKLPENKKSLTREEETEEEPVRGQPWIILGAVCAAQAGIGVVLLKVFRWTFMIGAWAVIIGIAAATAVIGTVIIYYRNHPRDSEDFWAPQDQGSDPGRFQDQGRNPGSYQGQVGPGRTESHETMVLQSAVPGILLKSVNPQLYTSVSVTRFPAVIGKEAGDAACRVAAPTVSRRHAKIEAVGKSFCLTDLRSTNGTFLNGEMLRPMAPTPLNPGDSVILGDVEFTFELWGETQ